MWSSYSGHLLPKEPEAVCHSETHWRGKARMGGTYRVSLSESPTLLPSVSILHKHDQIRKALREREARKGAEFPAT